MDESCQIGVSGHRRLPGADAGLLRQRLVEVLELAAGDHQSPRLATSLAEGVDRLVAGIAFDLGYSLYCPLPFRADDYERDFESAESIDAFRRLLAGAAQVTIAGLPAGATREEGYTAAGRSVLAASRLLLTVWDGQPARGEGGTGQMVAEALERSIPILWVAASPPHQLQVRLPGQTAWLPGIPSALRNWHE